MLLRAVWRLLKSIGFLLTGRMDAARQELNKDPHIIRARYEEVLREKKKRIRQFKDAVASLMAQRQEKVGKIKTLTEDIGRLEVQMLGAEEKARSAVARLTGQGQSFDAIRDSPEVLGCETAHAIYEERIKEKTQRIGDLTEDTEELRESIEGHRLQLQGLQREIEDLNTEASETVADMVSAQERESLANMVAGISNDRVETEIKELREMRAKMRCSAECSETLAGTDTQVKDREFFRLGSESRGKSKFQEAIGLSPDRSSGETLEFEREEAQEAVAVNSR